MGIGTLRRYYKKPAEDQPQEAPAEAVQAPQEQPVEPKADEAPVAPAEPPAKAPKGKGK
jgi:hypothetical protein